MLGPIVGPVALPWSRHLPNVCCFISVFVASGYPLEIFGKYWPR